MQGRPPKHPGPLLLAFALTLLLSGSSAAASPSPAHKPPNGFDKALRTSLVGYARLARISYEESARAAAALEDSVRAFLAAPSPATLEGARRAWLASREPYGRSEVFRFADGPIDNLHPVTKVEGPELRINAWPVDEAYLDYVKGDSTAGLIQDRKTPLDAKALLQSNGALEEAQVTLGFHPIEFLLWGQDQNAAGPGNRPFTDYLPGEPVRDRRRRCLELMAGLLAKDLTSVATEWSPGPKRYATYFLTLPSSEALGYALSGAATLSGFELAAERINVPLASRSQEDEHSCFSDNTHRDMIANVEGLALVLEGNGETPGLLPAIDVLDPALGREVRERLERARTLVWRIRPPFDAILLAPEDDSRRRDLEALAGELIGLAGALKRAGDAAGVRVAIGGGG